MSQIIEKLTTELTNVEGKYMHGELRLMLEIDQVQFRECKYKDADIEECNMLRDSEEDHDRLLEA